MHTPYNTLTTDLCHRPIPGLPEVLLVIFPTRARMTHTLCRLQEFYESADPSIRGSVFTHSDLLRSLMSDNGSVNYFQDTAGINFPRHALESFIVLFASTISDEEREFYDYLCDLEHRYQAPFKYFLAVDASATDADSNHELSHALWHCRSSYRIPCQHLLHTLRNQSPQLFHFLCQAMRRIGYHPDVWEDEIVAYLSTSSQIELESELCEGDADGNHWLLPALLQERQPFVEHFTIYMKELAE